MGCATKDWFGALSPRKREVVSGLAEGLSIKEIAQRLGISRETVKQHAAELYDLAGVHSARELLAMRWEQLPNSGAAALLKEEPASLDSLIASLLAKIRQIAPMAEVRLVPLQDAKGRGLEIPCALSAGLGCLQVDSRLPLPEHVADQVRLLALVASSKAVCLRRRDTPAADIPGRMPPPQAPPPVAALDPAVFARHLCQAVLGGSGPEERRAAARPLGGAAGAGAGGGC